MTITLGLGFFALIGLGVLCILFFLIFRIHAHNTAQIVKRMSRDNVQNVRQLSRSNERNVRRLLVNAQRRDALQYKLNQQQFEIITRAVERGARLVRDRQSGEEYIYRPYLAEKDEQFKPACELPDYVVEGVRYLSAPKTVQD